MKENEKNSGIFLMFLEIYTDLLYMMDTVPDLHGTGISSSTIKWTFIKKMCHIPNTLHPHIYDGFSMNYIVHSDSNIMTQYMSYYVRGFGKIVENLNCSYISLLPPLFSFSVGMRRQIKSIAEPLWKIK